MWFHVYHAAETWCYRDLYLVGKVPLLNLYSRESLYLKLANSFLKILGVERELWSPCEDGYSKTLYARHTLHPSGTGSHQSWCWYQAHQPQDKGRGWRGGKNWVLTIQGQGHLGHVKKGDPKEFTYGGHYLLRYGWNQHLYTPEHHAVLESMLTRNIQWCGMLDILRTETANFSG